LHPLLRITISGKRVKNKRKFFEDIEASLEVANIPDQLIELEDSKS
jgi:hypothetical protein